jgi:arsenate reductase
MGHPANKSEALSSVYVEDDLPIAARARSRRVASGVAAVTRVLFAGVRDAARTKIAEAWFNALAHPSRANAISAGTRPAIVDDQVRIAMYSSGVEIRSKPRLLTSLLLDSADLIVVIGPQVPGLSVHADEEWSIDDPVGASPDRIHEIKHEIEQRVRKLIVARGWSPFGRSM